jgi:hypothetical protein
VIKNELDVILDSLIEWHRFRVDCGIDCEVARVNNRCPVSEGDVLGRWQEHRVGRRDCTVKLVARSNKSNRNNLQSF